ncbi:GNAT family N-acetyltransferase [Nocardiopsis sp. SBT366]|uniref:GNAT family N-acetyltransferase n=1 Tax=Nocardiopsis sp. SBT366 TaxID=1580529 RepID=UPI00066E02C0|nr:GNAT family N-acetyltransferase [Nocardiopsis sp. SBT366]
MSEATVRPARPEDLPGVAELRWSWETEVHGAPDLPLAEFTARFVDWGWDQRDTHHCFVAVMDGAVAGMAWLAVTPRVPQPRAFERASGDVQCVYVRPELRDLGLGGQLIRAVLGLARELGMERVSVHSSDRAVPAYARHGFAVSPVLLQSDLRNNGDKGP